MDILKRFKLISYFVTVPSEALLRSANVMLDQIEERTGQAVEFVSRADLKSLEPKKLMEITKALVAYYGSLYGLDGTQVRLSAQMLEGELKKMFPFLSGKGDPDT